MSHNVIFYRSLLLVLTSVFFTLRSDAQTCNGFGDPVFTVDFGRGTSKFGSPLPAGFTNYNYSTAPVSDGRYTITNSSSGNYDSWHITGNHTPNDPDGYMMLVNADNVPNRIFFEQRVSGLCPNTTYQFGVWIFNLMRAGNPSPTQKPNISFEIYNSSNVRYSSRSTGEIPETGTWMFYEHVFTTPSTGGDITLKLVSNTTGGSNGNDLILDDITFRPCGPRLNVSINNNPVPQTAICEGESETFDLAATVGAGYNNPAFQWQQESGGNWVNIPGETASTFQVSLVNASPQVLRYRLLVAESGNINQNNCRTVSDPFIITVNSLPVVTPASNSPVCLGNDIVLTSNEGASYSWTGPNGFTSTERSPLLRNATQAMAGTYILTLRNAAGCESSVPITVDVNLPPVAAVSFPAVTICEGSSVQLSASGGTTYTWAPATGLSATNIANPVATPTDNTLYTVTVSDGTCQSTAQVQVLVNKTAVADAGADKVILEGQSIVLSGLVEGGDVSYFWTPSDYLDDPAKLNPVATPPQDIIYTLNVVSNSGCAGATDMMFVKVYKKVTVQNTFTPNGDGVNDTWQIIALEAYPENKVQVFNRDGALVYSDAGYKNQWDGRYRNKPLPAGVYYYTIYLDQVNKPLSGWVTIIK